MASDLSREDGDFIQQHFKLLVRVALLVYVIIGLLVYVFIPVEGGHDRLLPPIPNEFWVKFADALIIAAAIGATYDWYAENLRIRTLRHEFRNVFREFIEGRIRNIIPNVVGDELEVFRESIKDHLSDIATSFVLDIEELEGEIRRAESKLIIAGSLHSEHFQDLREEHVDPTYEIKVDKLTNDNSTDGNFQITHACNLEEWLGDSEFVSEQRQLFESKENGNEYELINLSSEQVSNIIKIDNRSILVVLQGEPSGYKVDEFIKVTDDDIIEDFEEYVDHESTKADPEEHATNLDELATLVEKYNED